MKKSLFHFTRLEYLPSILNRGLMTGRVPLDRRHVMPGICLTEIADPEEQQWVFPAIDTAGPKNGYRLSLDVDEGPRLMKWKFFARKFGLNQAGFRNLNRTGNGDPYRWYVHLDPIPISAIREIWCSRENRHLSKGELHELRQGKHVVGNFTLGEIWLSEQDVLARNSVAPESQDAA